MLPKNLKAYVGYKKGTHWKYFSREGYSYSVRIYRPFTEKKDKINIKLSLSLQIYFLYFSSHIK